MTDYSDIAESNIVASVIQSDEETFEEIVAEAVRTSQNVSLAASKVEGYITDVVWDVLNSLEVYEPIAYSLAYEGKLSMDYDGSVGEDAERIVRAYIAEHGSASTRSRSGSTSKKRVPSTCKSKSKSVPKSKSARSAKPKNSTKKGRC